MTLDHLRHSTPVLKPALALALLLVMVSVLLVSACGSTDPTAAPTPTDPVDPDPTATPTPTDPDPTAAPTPTDPVDPDPTATPTPTDPDPTATPTPTDPDPVDSDPTAGLLVPTPTPQTLPACSLGCDLFHAIDEADWSQTFPRRCCTGDASPAPLLSLGLADHAAISRRECIRTARMVIAYSAPKPPRGPRRQAGGTRRCRFPGLHTSGRQ